MKLFSMKFWLVFLGVVVVGVVAPAAYADVFGSGENAFEIEFVTIGDPGNAPDDPLNPAGAVDYVYRLGKYEVPEDAVLKANAASAAAGEPLGITLDERGPDKPATSITWFEAARFVNWLNTSKGRAPAYKFDDGPGGSGKFQLWEPSDPGYDANNLFRNRRAFYFLPSIDEWHKAAYYDPTSDRYFDYPTGSDSVPDGIDFVGDTDFEAVFFDGGNQLGPNDINDVGLLSPFNTSGQGGNVREWQEAAFDRLSDVPDEQRSLLGGSFADHPNVLLAGNSGIGTGPGFVSSIVGFRISAIVPEPSALSFIGIAFVGVCSLRLRLAFPCF